MPDTLPHVTLNMSMTADGKIASENRAVSSFGSPKDQRHLYDLRAKADAILCGARTLDLNKIALGSGSPRHIAARRKKGLPDHPLRVVVSGRATLDPAAHLFTKKLGPILLLTTNKAPKSRLRGLRPQVADLFVSGEDEVDFRAALVWLRERWMVRRLLCEGGGGINDALFRAGLFDEIHLTICPLILGGRSAPTLADGLGKGGLDKADRFRVTSLKRAGDELFLVLKPRHAT